MRTSWQNDPDHALPAAPRGNKQKAWTAGRIILFALMLAIGTGVALHLGCATYASKDCGGQVSVVPCAAQPQEVALLACPDEIDLNTVVADEVNSPEQITWSYYVAGDKCMGLSGAQPTCPPPPLPGRCNPGFNTNSFDAIEENPFLAVQGNPLSTFSIDVDTASYAIVRRMLSEEQLPSPGAVRIEEMINYFDYEDPQPSGDDPFSVNLESAQCPWAPGHRLVRVGIKGRSFEPAQRPPSNLVFLLDVSGSMGEPNKLPLVKRSMEVLLEGLDARDRVAIVVYAGSSGLVQPSTACTPAGCKKIRKALNNLGAGGSTQGSAGLLLAYETATENFCKEGVNQVILCTDGDFNVGVTSHDELLELIQQQAQSGVYLTVLGYGMGNLKDSTMEMLADKGNGQYGYIDTLDEARRMLGRSLAGTLVTIAKDVKIQVEFNPARVGAYRLIGYENRLMAKEDFNDDTKDAGEIGAGHSLTALYELVPAGQPIPGAASVDPLKYQAELKLSERSASDELFTLKLRYKEPQGDAPSKLICVALNDQDHPATQASRDLRFSAAVAEFGMLLRDSAHKGQATYDQALELAVDAKGRDEYSQRAEMVTLMRQAQRLSARQKNEG